jgi:hypothetical protein
MNKPIEIENLEETARVILRTNPAMEKMHSLTSMMESMRDIIIRVVKEGNSNFVATAGWLALIDEWEETIYVQLYVSSKFAHKLI